MSFWILLGSTINLPSLKRKLYVIHTSIDFFNYFRLIIVINVSWLALPTSSLIQYHELYLVYQSYFLYLKTVNLFLCEKNIVYLSCILKAKCSWQCCKSMQLPHIDGDNLLFSIWSSVSNELLWTSSCYAFFFIVNLLAQRGILFLSDTGRKVEDPELLEAIRLTIINNLLQYHPVISFELLLLFFRSIITLRSYSCGICFSF